MLARAARCGLSIAAYPVRTSPDLKRPGTVTFTLPEPEAQAPAFAVLLLIDTTDEIDPTTAQTGLRFEVASAGHWHLLDEPQDLVEYHRHFDAGDVLCFLTQRDINRKASLFDLVVDNLDVAELIN